MSSDAIRIFYKCLQVRTSCASVCECVRVCVSVYELFECSHTKSVCVHAFPVRNRTKFVQHFSKRISKELGKSKRGRRRERARSRGSGRRGREEVRQTAAKRKFVSLIAKRPQMDHFKCSLNNCE